MNRYFDPGGAATWAAVLAILACATEAPAQAGANPMTTAPASSEQPAYRIGPGDVLQIDVWKEPDASIPTVTVRPDGRISLPIIGEFVIAGSTPDEVKKILVEKYGALIREPSVNVSVREANSQKVYVIGEVRREGAIRMAGPITVLQALAEAGGVTDYANRKGIYVLRVTGGRQVHLPFNYSAVIRGQRLQQNVSLLPGDTIVVPR